MDTLTKPRFHVGSVPIYGDAILAPMARVSDVPYRTVCRAHGSAMHYTEFVAADSLLAPPNSHWRRLDKHPDESPLVFQIFGNDAQRLLKAAQKIVEWGPDIIDINMGCSVPRVSEYGAGVGMMLKPKLVAETFSLLSKNLPIPVTGKIRLGWDSTQRNFLEIAKVMEENGAQLIAMHGRTRSQKYSGQADWDSIAQLKQQVSVPVIGNGDVVVSADIDRMIAHTGCDAVMVGRAAIGNPWIFSRRDRETLSIRERFDTIRLHLHESVSYYGPGGLKLFERHLRKYLFGLPAKQLFRDLKSAETLDDYLTAISAAERPLSS